METNKQVKPTPARRFNANFATRAVLTLSAALLVGLGLRLGDVAIKSTAPKQTASAVQPQPEPMQPQVKAAAPAKVIQPAALKSTARPEETANAPAVAPAPVRTVYVERQAQPTPTQPDRLIYASYRTNSESEHDGDDEEGDDDEGEYGTSRNTVSVTPVRVVTRATGQVQPRTVRPSVVQPAQNVQRVQTVQQAQPRFVARPPVQPKAVTRGS